MKDVVQDSDPRRSTVNLRREWATLNPYGNSDWTSVFTPDRIAIEDRSGAVIAERMSSCSGTRILCERFPDYYDCHCDYNGRNRDNTVRDQSLLIHCLNFPCRLATRAPYLYPTDIKP